MNNEHIVEYFSMEIAIRSDVPTCAGGLVHEYMVMANATTRDGRIFQR